MRVLLLGCEVAVLNRGSYLFVECGRYGLHFGPGSLVWNTPRRSGERHWRRVLN